MATNIEFRHLLPNTQQLTLRKDQNNDTEMLGFLIEFSLSVEIRLNHKY